VVCDTIYEIITLITAKVGMKCVSAETVMDMSHVGDVRSAWNEADLI